MVEETRQSQILPPISASTIVARVYSLSAHRQPQDFPFYLTRYVCLAAHAVAAVSLFLPLAFQDYLGALPYEIPGSNHAGGSVQPWQCRRENTVVLYFSAPLPIIYKQAMD